jgi:hypothetical protein
MSVRDPRWLKTGQIVLVAVFGYWIGTMETRDIHTTSYWPLMSVYVVGILGSLYLVLRDVWKPST